MAWSNKARLAAIRARRAKAFRKTGSDSATPKEIRTTVRALRQSGLAMKGDKIVPLRKRPKRGAGEPQVKKVVVKARESNKAGYRTVKGTKKAFKAMPGVDYRNMGPRVR